MDGYNQNLIFLKTLVKSESCELGYNYKHNKKLSNSNNNNNNNNNNK
jgi:hypothetical protein